MDTERSRRHASKLLTYPITIGSVIHQYSALTLGNQRLTPEGSRSLAGMYTGTYQRFSVIYTYAISSAIDITRSHRNARDGRSLNRQTSNANIYPGRTGRIFLTSPCMGAAYLFVPSSTVPSLLHWAAGFSAKTSSHYPW